MRTIHVRTMVHSKTYKGILLEAEKKLSNFFELPTEDLKGKLNYEITIYESNDDGVTLPTFTGEVSARLRNAND
jgi:hypothetical protein